MSNPSTPLPWVVGKLPVHPYYVIGPCVKLSDGSSDIADVATVLFTEGGKTDAEFICRAANCHDDLLAALVRAAKLIEKARQYFPKSMHNSDKFDLENTCATIGSAIDQGGRWPMSAQKSKFELFQRLEKLGFSYDEAVQLRRIEMTLQRWAEAECGDSNGTCIERDEETGKPFRTYDAGIGYKRGRYPVADREAGALKRLAKLMALHPGMVSYHQGDCRGCMLYVLNKSELKDGAKIDQVYTRGVAVCS